MRTCATRTTMAGTMCGGAVTRVGPAVDGLRARAAQDDDDDDDRGR